MKQKNFGHESVWPEFFLLRVVCFSTNNFLTTQGKMGCHTGSWVPKGLRGGSPNKKAFCNTKCVSCYKNDTCDTWDIEGVV